MHIDLSKITIAASRPDAYLPGKVRVTRSAKGIVDGIVRITLGMFCLRSTKQRVNPKFREPSQSYPIDRKVEPFYQA